MEAAEVKFREFQWADSVEWQTYWNNIYPTPPLSKVEKYKRSWFRLNIDQNLSLTTSSIPPTQSRRTPSTQTTPYCNSKHVTAEVALRLLFVFLAVPLFATSLLVAMEQPLAIAYHVCVVLHYALTLTGIIREKGFPKFNIQWLQQAFLLDMTHYLLYGFVLVVSKPNPVHLVLPVVTCLIGYNCLMEKHSHQIPNFLTPCASFVFKHTKQHFSWLLHFRGEIECYTIFYLILQAFMKMGSFLTVFTYFNFLKIRLNVRDAFVLLAFSRINDSIVRFLSNRLFGGFPLTIYMKFCQLLSKVISGPGS